MSDTIILACSIIVASGVIVSGVAWVGRKLRPGWLRVMRMVDDWHGEPARPGFQEVPSFPVRQERVEGAVSQLGARMTRVEQQMRPSPNGIPSLADNVAVIRDAVTQAQTTDPH